MSELSFEAKVVLHLEDTKKGMMHRGTEFNLYMSSNLDQSHYITKEGVPNAEGAKALTQVLVQGLVANIHSCHEEGYIDSAEHLRAIISELERGFIEVTNVETTTFK